jgi:hypothetical protein
MDVLEKTDKQELIEAIQNSDDDRLIQQLLFHMQPKKLIDRDIRNAVTADELKIKLKKHIDSLALD